MTGVRRTIVLDSSDLDKVVEVAPSTERQDAIAVPSDGYMTIKDFLRARGIKTDDKHFSSMGKAVTEMCRRRSIEMQSQEDTRWGSIRKYPVSILKEFFGAS